jgi:PAS domain S-box-containing protein
LVNEQLQQANLTLRDSEEKLAVTLDSIGDAVIATDAGARVMRMNPVAEQLTGWTQAEGVGRQVAESFTSSTRKPSAATIPVMETLAHGTIQGLANHTVLIARDGQKRAIADSCAPIRDRDSQVVGAVLVFPRCHRRIRCAAGPARQRGADRNHSPHRGGRHHHPAGQSGGHRDGQPGRRADVWLRRGELIGRISAC